MELNDLVTLERAHLSWFRYPTHNIGTYLGRGVQLNIMLEQMRSSTYIKINQDVSKLLKVQIYQL